jgi:hypothetical protein
MWCSTARFVITSAPAIAVLLFPAATSARISPSLGVRTSRASDPASLRRHEGLDDLRVDDRSSAATSSIALISWPVREPILQE